MPATTFIFGFGSLISSESRSLTGDTGSCIPAKLTGFQRSWSGAFPILDSSLPGMTAVSVAEKADGSVNGVLVEIEPKNIPAFDKREEGYARVEVPMDKVQLCYDAEATEDASSTTLPSGSTIWVYIAPVTPPSTTTPILQSYLDVILLGCLEYGEQFAKDFLLTTAGWEVAHHGCFVNDRTKPAYRRATQAASGRAEQWDRLLAECVPDALAARKEV